MAGYIEPGYVETGYIGAPGSNAGFFLGVNSIRFEQAPVRSPQSTRLIQASAQSSGGDLYGYTVFATDKTLTLRWPALHRYYYEQLLAWFKDIAQGTAHTFTYRDQAGTERTVRFLSAELPAARRITPERYQVELTLWIES